MKRWHADVAWLGNVENNVLIEVDGDRITAVTPHVDPPPDAVRLTGFTVPGLANVHSHAFHRALRGRTQAGEGDFWTWRTLMYDRAARLDPDNYYQLARATYAEMALAGITAVGEFHYVHHDRDGTSYADPNAMGLALIAAAHDAGIRITLLDTCYLWSGLGKKPPEGTQVRFTDDSAEAWATRAAALSNDEATIIGAAIHSVRAVDAPSMTVVRDWTQARQAPLHLHLSEQRQENEQCLAATGQTPTQLLASNGILGPRTTVVHATHLEDADIESLGKTRTNVCFCPTTERDLGDGIGPARSLALAGCPLCLGSDMHCLIDLFEDARAMELNERLHQQRRGIHRPAALLEALTIQGMQALGWKDAGRIAPGALADFITVSLDSPRLAGTRQSEIVEHLIFCATASDVTDVIVGGNSIVAQSQHSAVGNVGLALAEAIALLDAVNL